MNKYELISKEIRRRIVAEIYSMDQPIPDEITLSKEFSCSRMTMKRALDILVTEGLLFRRRGHGTFIVKSGLQNAYVNVDNENKGLTNLLIGKKVTSKIIKFDVLFPTKEVASQLAIDTNNPVYDIIRLRYVEGEPYVLEKTHMPVNIIGGINEAVLHGSIYNHISEGLKLSIAGFHRKIRACKPDELDRIYLGCQPDDPILEVEQVAYLNTGVAFEYSFSRHRYDRFVFTTVNITKK